MIFEDRFFARFLGRAQIHRITHFRTVRLDFLALPVATVRAVRSRAWSTSSAETCRASARGRTASTTTERASVRAPCACRLHAAPRPSGASAEELTEKIRSMKYLTGRWHKIRDSSTSTTHRRQRFINDRTSTKALREESLPRAARCVVHLRGLGPDERAAPRAGVPAEEVESTPGCGWSGDRSPQTPNWVEKTCYDALSTTEGRIE